MFFYINLECQCDKLGTEYCNYTTGECTCLPGIEGVNCDTCKADHFGFGDPAGCTYCNCR